MSHVTRVMVAFLFVTISLLWAVPSLALVTCSTSTMGGAESEAIVIQPSGAGNGQVIVTNSADGDFTINDDDGAVTDTDTLVLRGTNPDTPGLSGENTVVIDFSALGDADNLKITVSDSIGGLLYQVRDVTGTKRISFELLDWVEPAARSLLPARSAGGGQPEYIQVVVDETIANIAADVNASLRMGAEPLPVVELRRGVRRVPHWLRDSFSGNRSGSPRGSQPWGKCMIGGYGSRLDTIDNEDLHSPPTPRSRRR